jgi:hypothetical protein
MIKLVSSSMILWSTYIKVETDKSITDLHNIYHYIYLSQYTYKIVPKTCHDTRITYLLESQAKSMPRYKYRTGIVSNLCMNIKKQANRK